MLRRIYLLRHGDVSYFSSDGKPVSFHHATLNENGIAQASALGEILAPVSFQSAYTAECCVLIKPLNW